MKAVNKIFYLFCSLFFVQNAFCAQYSFESAYARALSTSETVLAAQKEAEKYGAQRKAAFGLYMPKAGVKGSYTFLDGPIVMDLNSIRSTIVPLYPPGTNIPPFIETIQDDRFFKAEVYATLPVFTGGKLRAANAAAAADYEAALAKLEGARNNILTEVSSKYFGAMLAEEVVNVREHFLQSASQNSQDAAKMYQAGMISKVEKMAVDIIYSQAKRDYNSSVNDAALANTLLQNLLSEKEDVTFSSSLFVTDTDKMEAVAYYQKQAQGANSILKVLDAKMQAADAAVKAQTSQFMPTVYLFGSRELYKDDLTILDPVYSYGAGFSWSLFEGGSDVNKTKAALRQREAVRYLRQKHAKDINTAVEYYYKKMQNALMNYKAVQDEISYTREFYAARVLGFKAGTSTSLEVNMALVQRMKAELDSLQAQYDFVVSLANMLSISSMTADFENYKKQSY